MDRCDDIYTKQFNHSSWLKSSKGAKNLSRKNAVDLLSAMSLDLKTIEKRSGKDSYDYKYYKKKYDSSIKKYETKFNVVLEKIEFWGEGIFTFKDNSIDIEE